MRQLPYTLRQLQYALSVADCGGFRKAAEACHVAQPSLSTQVRELEDALAVVIFERAAGGVRTTPAGERILARARTILVEAEALVESAGALADPFASEFRLGVIPTIAPYALASFASGLAESLPRLRAVWVEDKTAALVAKLERGELDAAVVALEADLGSLESIRIGADPFVLAGPASHPLLRSTSRRLSTDALRGETVHLLDDGHCFRDQANDLCSSAGARESGFRATSLATLVRVVLSSNGVTLLPALSLPVENRDGELAIRRFTKPEPSRTIGLAFRASTPRRASLEAVAKGMRAAHGERIRT